jgi:organic hydroperoxide reductase OsmC/OhrA
MAGATLLYRSRVSAVPGGGPDKVVMLPAEPEPVVMGASGELARHLGVADGHREHASTLDYLVAAATACMSGSFVRALAARGLVLDKRTYHAEGVGQIHLHGQVPVLERIEIVHRLSVDSTWEELLERVHAVYHKGCAVSRSIGGSIEIESRLALSR